MSVNAAMLLPQLGLRKDSGRINFLPGPIKVTILEKVKPISLQDDGTIDAVLCWFNVKDVQLYFLSSGLKFPTEGVSAYVYARTQHVDTDTFNFYNQQSAIYTNVTSGLVKFGEKCL